MKNFFSYLLGILIISSLSNCGNAKQLQEKAPVAFGSPYFTSVVADDPSVTSHIKLYLPTGKSLNDSEIQLDSVYFRGRKAKLVKSEEEIGLYIATFETAERPRDFIMSSDPNEEYGNQVPFIEDKTFDLKSDEAMLTFTRGEKSEHYKIEGIFEKEVNSAK